MNRRNFILSSSTMLAASSLRAAEEAHLTDCHVYLGASPFRKLGSENRDEFIAALARQGVTDAWAGAFEGVLRRDLAAVNLSLTRACRGTMLRPCGSINPILPDWQDDVRRCVEVHGMHIIRLHPNYHGYDLRSPAFRELLALAMKHRLLVQLVVQMEDERTQNPGVRAAPVYLQPLPGILQEMKDARVMLLNATASMPLRHVQACPGLWLDFAMIEGVGGVENLLKTWPSGRLVFGSYAPFFYWESARLKIQESALSPAQDAAVLWRNAAALLAEV
jgi:predicted TIM-barrel fold metal-dependent hydrolase